MNNNLNLIIFKVWTSGLLNIKHDLFYSFLSKVTKLIKLTNKPVLHTLKKSVSIVSREQDPFDS